MSETFDKDINKPKGTIEGINEGNIQKIADKAGDLLTKNGNIIEGPDGDLIYQD